MSKEPESCPECGGDEHTKVCKDVEENSFFVLCFSRWCSQIGPSAETKDKAIQKWNCLLDAEERLEVLQNTHHRKPERNLSEEEKANFHEIEESNRPMNEEKQYLQCDVCGVVGQKEEMLTSEDEKFVEEGESVCSKECCRELWRETFEETGLFSEETKKKIRESNRRKILELLDAVVNETFDTGEPYVWKKQVELAFEMVGWVHPGHPEMEERDGERANAVRESWNDVLTDLAEKGVKVKAHGEGCGVEAINAPS